MRAGRFSAGVLVILLVSGVCIAVAPAPAQAAVIFSVTYSNNRINQQDANTGVVQNSFAPPVVAQGGGGAGLAASGTELFYSSIDNVNIYRLNPTTGAVISFFARPSGATNGIDALAYGSSSFGPTLFAQDYVVNTMHLLNPATGAVFTSYPLSFDAIGGIDFDSTTNQLWVSDTGGVIRALNPNTGAVISSINTGTFQTGVGLVDGRLFTVATSPTTISERNKTTGAVINSFPTANNAAASALAGIVPEPATLSLLALLAPTALMRRRKEKRHS